MKQNPCIAVISDKKGLRIVFDARMTLIVSSKLATAFRTDPHNYKRVTEGKNFKLEIRRPVLNFEVKDPGRDLFSHRYKPIWVFDKGNP
jgi:hypothetical protein